MPLTFSDSHREAFARDVVVGLGSTPKSLKPKYFYDATGSELFEEITRQPEYYMTRTEAELLRQCAPALSNLVGKGVSVVELGSGSSAKTAILLESFLETSEELHYLPIDISKSMLHETADRLDARYPALDVTPIASPYEAGLKRASTLVAADDQVPDCMLVLFLGSSIGNMEHDESVQFLKGLREHLEPKDAFLIGFDLQKDVAILNAAYNDAADQASKKTDAAAKQGEQSAEEAKQSLAGLTNQARDLASQTLDSANEYIKPAEENASGLVNQARATAAHLVDNVSHLLAAGQQKAGEVADEASKKAGEAQANASKLASDAVDAGAQKAGEAQKNAQGASEQASKALDDAAAQAKGTVKGVAGSK